MLFKKYAFTFTVLLISILLDIAVVFYQRHFVLNEAGGLTGQNVLLQWLLLTRLVFDSLMWINATIFIIVCSLLLFRKQFSGLMLKNIYASIIVFGIVLTLIILSVYY
jgi:hypothetical protein